MPETLPTLHADMREILAVNGEKVSVEKTLFCCLVFTELAFVHFVGGWRDLKLGFSVVVLQTVGEQRRLLVKLFSADFTLKWGFTAEGVNLHVVVETGFFVSGEITVRALVFLSVYDILMVVLGVALEESTRLELLPT